MTTPTSVVCNRKACQKPLPEPRWWNTSTRAYYCADCKWAITRYPENANIFEDHAMTTPTSEPTRVCERCGKQGADVHTCTPYAVQVAELRAALAKVQSKAMQDEAFYSWHSRRLVTLLGLDDDNVHDSQLFLAAIKKVADMQSALANAEREREEADGKRRQTEAAHADLALGLMSAYEDLATLRAERDALQHTVAAYGDLLQRSQEMVACFDDPEAMAYDGATTKAYFRQAVAALTTPTREGSTDA